MKYPITIFWILAAYLCGTIPAAAKTVTETGVLARVLEVDSTGERCVIDRGLAEGLVPGSDGRLYENRGDESSADLEWSMVIAIGRVVEIDSHQAVVALADIKTPVKAGDCYEGDCVIEESVRDRTLYAIAANDITFTYLEDGAPFFTFADLRLDRDGRRTAAVIDRLLAEIHRNAELAASVSEEIIHGGMFDGRTLTDVFAASTLEHVNTFLEFVRYYPGKYLLNTYRFVDAYGTWAISAAPTAKDKIAQNQASEVLEQVQALVDTGRYEDAMTKVQEALKIKPDYESARKYMEKLDGILRSQRVLASDPDNVNAHVELGRGLYYFNHEAEAVQHYQAAIRLGFTVDDVHLFLGYALTSLGRYEEAMAAFKTVRDRNPRDKTAAKWLAFAAAKKNLGQTGDVESRFIIAGIKYDEGNYDEAIQEYEKVLRQDPNSDRARQLIKKTQLRSDADDYLRWAKENWTEHEYDRAEERFGQALDACTEAGDTAGMVEVMETFGQSLKESQRYDEAIAVFDRITQIQPGYLDAYIEIGRTYSDLGQTDSALSWIRKGLAVDSLSAWAHNMYGYLLYPLGRNVEALTHLQRAAALDTTYQYPYYSMGQAYIRMGDYAKAAAAFRKALAIDPDYADARSRLSNLRALMECDSLARAGIRDTLIPLRRARALYGVDLYDQALTAVDEAIYRQPDNADAWRFMG